MFIYFIQYKFNMSNTTQIFSGIIILNTSITIQHNDKNGYIFHPLYDLTKKFILFSDKIQIYQKKHHIHHMANLFVTVSSNLTYYNNMQKVVLNEIIGVTTDISNHINALYFYSPSFTIKKKLYNTHISADTYSNINAFIDSLRINDSFQTFSIDPRGSVDIDDAISYIDEFNFIIHIADPNRFNHIVDLTDFYKNLSSVYFNSNTHHILPIELATDLISLIENKKRPVISLYFDVRHEPVLKKIVRQNIIVNQNLSYDDANNILCNETTHHIQQLFGIAKKLSPFYYQNRKNLVDTHDMIELFMLLANHKISEFLIHHLTDSDNILFRNHSNDIAFYSYTNIGHDILNLPSYVHFTSPIRRTADFITHEHVINCIEKIDDKSDRVIIPDILHFNQCIYHIKCANNIANYLHVIELINNGSVYRCKLIDFNSTCKFKWLILDHNVKFMCYFCHADFADKFQHIFDSLIVNNIYEIKLYKSTFDKLQTNKILFDFNLS